MEHLPDRRPDSAPPVPQVVRLPDGTHTYADPATLTPQVVHVHQAPPDRTVARLALGAGTGAGAVAAGVYFGPLLVGALASMAVSLLAVTLAVAVTCWAVVHVVRSVGGAEGQAAAKTLRRKR
ncbi:DUF6251 family protein [Streptomyces sp. GSL17-111]|uniref:DUF6251 family protein n=1 Tax=Streptomyces sp. GSL17-111 TaxID=3121596 RepID=UPI0030F45EE1